MTPITFAQLKAIVARGYGDYFAAPSVAFTNGNQAATIPALVAWPANPVGMLLQVGTARYKLATFDDCTGAISFRPAFAAASGSYAAQIWPAPPDRIGDHINEAIRNTPAALHTQCTIETLSVSPPLYETDLPPGCDRVLNVEVRAATSLAYEPAPAWQVINNAGARVLRFPQGAPWHSNLRVTHTERPAELVNDTDTLTTNSGTTTATDETPLVNFIREQALHYLFESAHSDDDAELRRFRQRSAGHLAKAQAIAASAPPFLTRRAAPFPAYAQNHIR